MGYIAHRALIITGSDLPDVSVYRESLPEEFRGLLIGPIMSAANGYSTIVFVPDGSKEGWDTSDEADRIRIELARMMPRDVDVVEVRFGGDDYDVFDADDPRDRKGGVVIDGEVASPPRELETFRIQIGQQRD